MKIGDWVLDNTSRIQGRVTKFSDDGVMAEVSRQEGNEMVRDWLPKEGLVVTQPPRPPKTEDYDPFAV